MSYIALLTVDSVDRYRGIYRRPPIFPKKKSLYSKWIDYIELTEGGFPIEYTYSNYNDMLLFYIQLFNEHELVDFIIIENDMNLNIKTDLLGYDVTNSTMFYSILGEINTWKNILDKSYLNSNGLFNNRDDANLLAKYMNNNISLFECDGLYKSVSISKIIV